MSSISPLTEQRGAVIVWASTMLALLVSAAALVIDIGRGYDRAETLQGACDAAAFGAARAAGERVALGAPQDSTAAAVSTALAIATSNGFPSGITVECGRFDFATGAFTVTGNCGTMPSGPTIRRAVRVSGVTTSFVSFGRLLGSTTLSPRASAIAVFQPLAGCAKPFAVNGSLLPGTIGSTFTTGSSSPGNWGKIDLGGINSSSNPAFTAAMQNGICTTVSLPLSVSVGPGASSMGGQGSLWNSLIGQEMYVGVIFTPFPNGSGSVTIEQFARVVLESVSGQGNSWTATWRLLEYPAFPPAANGTTARELVG